MLHFDEFFLNSLFHGILFFPSNLFPPYDACLDNKKNAGYIVENGTDEGQAKGPGKVIVFPVRHEIAAVTQGTKNNECYSAKCA